MSSLDGQLLSDALEYRHLVGFIQVPLALDSPLVYHGPLILCGFNTRPHTLHGFSDADWAGCPDTRRSTTSFFVFLGPNLISWSAKKQHTVSHSSAKAEYQSLAHVCADTTWISYLHHELAIPSSGPTLLICDNMSTTHMASNPVFYARTKHIELDYHFIREHILSFSHRVHFVLSADQLADIFTKGLSTQRI
ncbi:hypothetical protein L3X38_028072 [Prunus dulcis]|uniref:Retrovirus-related Pol polyprotein from transposon RE2 n=1 Tax=Prunus dulcis TaxID=3755 RepID=A0AAD4Z0Y0_PRUDU|nr:hypothetical protein L3X38_028072 [Prunus dulcis]